MPGFGRGRKRLTDADEQRPPALARIAYLAIIATGEKGKDGDGR
jgi:hypothetical protein